MKIRLFKPKGIPDLDNTKTACYHGICQTLEGDPITPDPKRIIRRVLHEDLRYEIVWEQIETKPYRKIIILRYAENLEGEYIGDMEMTRLIVEKLGIYPEVANPKPSDGDHVCCSIGFCEKEQKWYGWSHRALFGFQIGDTVSKGDCTASSGWSKEYLKEHPEEDVSLPIGFKAETLEDCKLMAIAYADSVG